MAANLFVLLPVGVQLPFTLLANLVGCNTTVQLVETALTDYLDRCDTRRLDSPLEYFSTALAVR